MFWTYKRYVKILFLNKFIIFKMQLWHILNLLIHYVNDLIYNIDNLVYISVTTRKQFKL